MTDETNKLAAFRLDPWILRDLQRVKTRDGLPASEQARRALETWLVQRGFGQVCPDCHNGALVADRRFVAGLKTAGRAGETREPFWSMDCPECKHRFNYSPESDTLRRFEGDPPKRRAKK